VAGVDWTATFAVYGLLAVVPLGGFWVASAAVGSLDDRSLHAADRTVSSVHGVRTSDLDRTDSGTLEHVLRTPSVLVLCATTFAAMSVYVFLNSWMPTYLAEDLRASLAAGGVVVAVLPAMGILSRTGGGVVSDRLFDGRRRPVVVLSFLVPLPLLVVLAAVSTVAAAVVVLVVAGFFVQLAVGVLFTAPRDLVDPRIAGTAVATVTAAGAVGSFSAPIVAGALIDATGSFLAAFAYGAVLGLAGLGLASALPDPGRRSDHPND
jgi:sugar phosphate permease